MDGDDIRKAEKFCTIMKIFAVMIPILLILASFNLLSLDDVLNARKAEISEAKFKVQFEKYCTYSRLIIHVKDVYLAEKAEIRLGSKIVHVPSGTVLEFGLKRLSLLLIILPLTVATAFGAVKMYRMSSNKDESMREILSREDKPFSPFANALLTLIFLGFLFYAVTYSLAYFPLTLAYPLIDVNRIVYVTKDFSKLMSPTYVLSTYALFICSNFTSASIGLFFYSLAKGTELTIEEFRMDKGR